MTNTIKYAINCIGKVINPKTLTKINPTGNKIKATVISHIPVNANVNIINIPKNKNKMGNARKPILCSNA